jgi:hypothetical protein
MYLIIHHASSFASFVSNHAYFFYFNLINHVYCYQNKGRSDLFSVNDTDKAY